MKGVLYLIPNTLGEYNFDEVLPWSVINIVTGIKHFVVEDIRTARRFLKALDHDINIDEINFYEIDKHDINKTDFSDFIEPCLNGENIGLLSEAGCSAVADPGALIVASAHKHGIRVVPCTGPSSILLALMGSGFNGQNFQFHGYLPIKENRASLIKKLENESLKFDRTQIFIETPYRNNQLLDEIIANCLPATSLCVAVDLTLKTELIISQTIKQWKNSGKMDLNKRPTVFLIYGR